MADVDDLDGGKPFGCLLVTRIAHRRGLDFTYVRARADRVYVAFIVDVFSEWIFVWNAQTSK